MFVLYDDAQARTFAPFSLTRPLASMRAGAELICGRWRHQHAVRFLSSPHFDTFHETGASAVASGMLAPRTLIANARCVPALGTALDHTADVWRVGGEIAVVRLAKPLPAEALHDGSLDLASLAVPGAREAVVGGRWLERPWDLIRHLPDMLAADVIALATSKSAASISVKGERIGEHPVIVDAGAIIEPHVVFDTTAGPVIICASAHVHAFTRIAGPCFIGARTQILGGRISGASIGDDCRVHVDVSPTIFVGQANKAHEGFVGHSIVGRWANLGAGTTTSNLKNSYGGVRMWAPDGTQNTGLTSLGSLIGDHAKLGIGTMLSTGSVIGAGANIFGARPPRRVAPFMWGEAAPFERFQADKFLDIAAKVMARRNVTLDDASRSVLARAGTLADTDEW
jgi:UDP-N-acetylglucosamine diphosphorylase/glucosamine-1-phosphate N-acetyltransferase